MQSWIAELLVANEVVVVVAVAISLYQHWCLLHWCLLQQPLLYRGCFFEIEIEVERCRQHNA